LLRDGLFLDAFDWFALQYLILANGARGRAAVALVQQAISNPHLFHFGELIDHENIAALDGALPPALFLFCSKTSSQMLPLIFMQQEVISK
jgi:hypothetical protein